jgi:DNA-binding response OmpR family regulator
VPTLSPLVAIFNASDDTVEMLEQVLHQANFRTANGHVADIKRGELDFVAFMADHEPEVIIWDISPPYEQNWRFFQLLRTSSELRGCGIVVTTTNKQHLDRLAGGDSGAIEIIGKPYDLELIVSAVKAKLPSADSSLPNSPTP